MALPARSSSQLSAALGGKGEEGLAERPGSYRKPGARRLIAGAAFVLRRRRLLAPVAPSEGSSGLERGDGNSWATDLILFDLSKNPIKRQHCLGKSN